MEKAFFRDLKNTLRIAEISMLRAPIQKELASHLSLGSPPAR
jgi:hypothetical protein